MLDLNCIVPYRTGPDRTELTRWHVCSVLHCRRTYPASVQFTLLCKFIIDQTQSPNLKAKLAILSYMTRVVREMKSHEFMASSSDTKLAVSRIVTWSTEPRSPDVRDRARALIVALFDLNSSEFSQMLWTLPKPFQASFFQSDSY